VSRTRHGKHRQRRRGVRKRATGPEVRRWVKTELIPPPEPWMDASTYGALGRLRAQLAVPLVSALVRGSHMVKGSPAA
jgi:hypothetical protein